MLVIGLKPNESFTIGKNIKIIFQKVCNGQARIAIQAPKEIPILRENAKIKYPLKKIKGEDYGKEKFNAKGN